MATKKASTRATDRGRIERHIKPLLDRKNVGAVTRGDVERLLQDVAAGRTAAREKTGFRGLARVTGGTGAATKAVSVLSAIYNFAIARKLFAENPARGVRKFKERRFERFLSPAELARLGEAIAAAEREGANPAAVTAIRLLTLTGCRKGEILSLRWDFIDWPRACLRLPDSKTGAKMVPLGAPALALLESLPRVDGNPYVLPSARGCHLVGLQEIWVGIRERAGLGRLRLHDLRHSFASVGAAGGDSLLVIGALLGQRDQATTQRYAHLAADPLRVAADRIANEIARATRAEGGQLTSMAATPGGSSAADDHDEPVASTPQGGRGDSPPALGWRGGRSRRPRPLRLSDKNALLVTALVSREPRRRRDDGRASGPTRPRAAASRPRHRP